MAELGIRPRYIVQSEAYRRGDYVAQMIRAIEARLAIFDILSEYQTLDRFEKDVTERREEYYPLRVYCEACGKDDTTIRSYEQGPALIYYDCQGCRNSGAFSLFERVPCKLVWKVDWPMRWHYEGVDFEPAGEDHAAPGSSYTVGQRIIQAVYGDPAPYFIPYAFVGMAGRSKMSSSAGAAATPRAALDILEPPILRWLYLRRQPGQKFNVDFGQEVLRLYDEWDAFAQRASGSTASPGDRKIYHLCTRTSAGPVRMSTQPVSFRLLSSAANITQGSREQIVRIAAGLLAAGLLAAGSLAAGSGVDPAAAEPAKLSSFAEGIRPRLDCAIQWATRYLPDDERTHIRPAFSPEAYHSLDEQSRQGLAMLLADLDKHWSLDGLTALIYSVPKRLLGLPADAQPTPVVKEAQRRFFKAVYTLICAADTGPRIPTLFLSLGMEKARTLLAPAD